MTETITASAVQIDGLTLSLPQPAGHGEVLSLIVDAFGEPAPHHVQGFLTSVGRFVTRVEAMKIVHRAGQPFREPPRGHELFSEDLW